MSAKIIDGKAVASAVRDSLSDRIAARTAAGKRPPGLVTILVGEDPASKVYVGNKQRSCAKVGIFSESANLSGDVSQDELVACIERYNARDDIDGILLQLPVPGHLDSDYCIDRIDPAKDVDGLHTVSQGALMAGGKGLRPCTPRGCMRLLAETGLDLSGKRAVVVGRSRLVGKPVALLLLDANATVTVCHSRSSDLADEVRRAEVVIAAAGRPHLVRGDWIADGAVVIDVGIHRTDNGLTGDVDFDAASERASWITPVPGGVGPMTVAMLLENTFDACVARSGE